MSSFIEKMTGPYQVSLPVVQPPERPIPNYGDLMLMEDFVSCVTSGSFIDDDGHGYYSNGVTMTDIVVKLDHILSTSYSHVVWFNR